MQEIEVAAGEAIAAKVFPGCVIGVIENGSRRAMPFGCHTYAEDSQLVTENSLYDCASITKSVPTATLALQLLDEGTFALDDKLITYIPEYRTKYRDQVTIRHLLTYTLGTTTPLSSLKDKAPEEIFEAVCTEETHPPNTIFSYSNTPAFLLGIVIERILGTTLEKAAQERIFTPLRMTSATFTPQGAVPTEEGVVDIRGPAAGRGGLLHRHKPDRTSRHCNRPRMGTRPRMDGEASHHKNLRQNGFYRHVDCLRFRPQQSTRDSLQSYIPQSLAGSRGDQRVPRTRV